MQEYLLNISIIHIKRSLILKLTIVQCFKHSKIYQQSIPIQNIYKYSLDCIYDFFLIDEVSYLQCKWENRHRSGYELACDRSTATAAFRVPHAAPPRLCSPPTHQDLITALWPTQPVNLVQQIHLTARDYLLDDGATDASTRMEAVRRILRAQLSPSLTLSPIPSAPLIFKYKHVYTS